MHLFIMMFLSTLCSFTALNVAHALTRWHVTSDHCASDPLCCRTNTTHPACSHQTLQVSVTDRAGVLTTPDTWAGLETFCVTLYKENTCWVCHNVPVSDRKCHKKREGPLEAAVFITAITQNYRTEKTDRVSFNVLDLNITAMTGGQPAKLMRFPSASAALSTSNR